MPLGHTLPMSAVVRHLGDLLALVTLLRHGYFVIKLFPHVRL
jgi:hypothetical protein